MKVVWIMHDIVLTDEIQALLDELGIVGFSRWKRMTGRGPLSGTRMDSHVWPGANSGTATVLDEATAARLMERLQELRDRIGKQNGIWAFTTPVLDVLK